MIIKSKVLIVGEYLKERWVMGITVQWDTEEKRIIRQNYEPHWDWDEYRTAFKQTAQLAQEVDYAIGIIAEVATMRYIPHEAVIYGSQAILSLPDNIAVAVVVTPSNIVKTLFNVITRVVRFKKATYASSVNEARIYIEMKIGHLSTDNSST